MALCWWLVGLAVLLLLLFLLCDCDWTLGLLSLVGRPVASLSGRVIWVTGASSGIGEALSVQLAQHGCRLALSARRADQLERVRQRCLRAGAADGDLLVLPMDVTQPNQQRAAFDQLLSRFGRLDVLVNNAGRSQRSGWQSTDPAVDRQLFELNVFAPVQLTRLVLPQMLGQPEGGHVVVMSSTAGTAPVPFSGSYTGSKHALHGYFGALRSELSRRGVRVTLLCPGPTFSNLLPVAFVDRPGEVYGQDMQATDKRMSADRCAYLCAVAIANHLSEAWIAIQPVLLFQYLNHYLPWIQHAFFRYVGPEAAMKLRDSKEDFAKTASDKNK